MKKITILLMLGTLLFGCNNESEQPMGGSRLYVSKNFIQGYIIPTDIQIVQLNDTWGNSLSISFIGAHDITNLDTNKINPVFDELAIRYGDTNYNQELSSDLATANFAVAYPVAISIVSDTDYDVEHPAGTPLDDVVEFSSSSAYPYIKNGYSNIEYPFYKGFNKRISEVTEDDMTLLRPNTPYNTLHFIDAPTDETHNVTIKIYCGEQEFVKTIEHTF